MVKQYRLDGSEIPYPDAIAEGEAAPPLDISGWVEDLPPVRPELLDAVDPGEPTPILTYSQASENNIQRVMDLITSHLIHDERYAPLQLRDQVTVLVLAINRLMWNSEVLRNHEWNLPNDK